MLPGSDIPTGWKEGEDWKCHLVRFSKWKMISISKALCPWRILDLRPPSMIFLSSQSQENLRMPLQSLGMFHLEINLSECRVPWVLVEFLDV